MVGPLFSKAVKISTVQMDGCGILGKAQASSTDKDSAFACPLLAIRSRTSSLNVRYQSATRPKVKTHEQQTGLGE